jgi:hypothetical protein
MVRHMRAREHERHGHAPTQGALEDVGLDVHPRQPPLYSCHDECQLAHGQHSQEDYQKETHTPMHSTP